MGIELESVVSRVQGHISAEVDGELVVLSVEQGKYFGFDDIAQVIWERLKEPVRVASLCLELGSEFDAAPLTIETDVLRLLNRLHSEEMIVLAS